MLEDLAGSEDLSIFESETVKDLIEFKWNRFGFYFNLFGFLVHGFNVLMIFLYIDYVYINGSTDSLENERHVKIKQKYLKIIVALVGYPLFYETLQIYREDFAEYWGDTGNYFDWVFIIGSFTMVGQHWNDPYSFLAKLNMSIVVSLAIRRTFNFLRIFDSLSPIVTMLNNVIW